MLNVGTGGSPTFVTYQCEVESLALVLFQHRGGTDELNSFTKSSDSAALRNGEHHVEHTLNG